MHGKFCAIAGSYRRIPNWSRIAFSTATMSEE